MNVELTEDQIHTITEAACTRNMSISEFIIKSTIHLARCVNKAESRRLKSVEKRKKDNPTLLRVRFCEISTQRNPNR